MKEKKRSTSDGFSLDKPENPTRQSIQKNNLRTYEIVLEVVYKQAKAEGRIVRPDEAMSEAENKISCMVDKESVMKTPSYVQVKRLTPSNMEFIIRRKAHHIAVDLFYRTYDLIKSGAPRLSNDESIDLQEKGLNHADIAKEIGLSVKTPEAKKRSKDVIRKRIEAAKKRSSSK